MKPEFASFHCANEAFGFQKKKFEPFIKSEVASPHCANEAFGFQILKFRAIHTVRSFIAEMRRLDSEYGSSEPLMKSEVALRK